jgi:hypothetical protein
MKRYRLLSFDLDSRASFLTMEIDENWEEAVKEGHAKGNEEIERGLIEQLGALDADGKKQNFIDLGTKTVSIVAFHNTFWEQIRIAFVMGAYYPAMTAACALGERILNHLVRTLREDYKSTPQYKDVYERDSYNDWNRAIDVLVAWDVLLPEVAEAFRKLADLRNRKVIHFNPEADTNTRELALEAIQLLGKIIGEQFSAFGNQPWFITDIPGEIYIKKQAEEQPFVKRVYLPKCALVGPNHRLELEGTRFRVHEESQYEDREISDDEFVKLRQARRANPA